MTINGLKKIFQPEPRQINHLTNVGPDTAKLKIPRDIGLELAFPSETQAPEDRIIYALWKEGEQPFSNLLILSGLRYREIKVALNNLVDQGKIKKRNSSSVDSIECATFSINKR